MKRRFHSSLSGRAGFTLLEMVMAMTILVLLGAAVFGIVTTVLKGSSTLHDNQNRRDQIAALSGFLRRKLGDLPAAGILVSYKRGDGAGLDQNGIVFGGNAGSIAIDASLQDNGYYTLRRGFIVFDGAKFSSGPEFISLTLPDVLVKQDDPSFTWTPLIRDIKTLHWKFQDFSSNEWQDEWNNANSRPNIIEFSMEMAGESQPIIMDFWLPHLTPASASLSSSTLPRSAPSAPLPPPPPLPSNLTVPPPPPIAAPTNAH